MPNTGKASRGCFTCRRRRVKCDLARPECHRCQKIGQPCHGYREEIDLLFKHKDTQAIADSLSGKNKGRHGEVEPTRESAPDTDTTRRAQPAGRPNSQAVTHMSQDSGPEESLFDAQLPLVVVEPWESHAISLVLSQLAIPLNEQMRRDGTGTLAVILRGAHDQSAIVLTCKALAMTYFSNKIGTLSSLSMRARSYSQALEATNMLLSRTESQTTDQAALCVCLLGLCELFVPSPTSTISWAIHTRGLIELLCLRGPNQFRRGTSRDLFWSLFNTVQIRALIAGVELPNVIQTWLEENVHRFDESDLRLCKVSRFAYRTTSYCSRVRLAMELGKNCHSHAILAFWNDLVDLHRQLNEQLFLDPLETSIDFSQLFRHNNLRTYLSKAILYFFEFLQKARAISDVDAIGYDATSISWHARDMMQTLADGTLSTVPYIVNSLESIHPISNTAADISAPIRPSKWADALRVFWPLRLIATHHGIFRHDQAERARLALSRIGKALCMQPIVGIKNAERNTRSDIRGIKDEPVLTNGGREKAFRAAIATGDLTIDLDVEA